MEYLSRDGSKSYHLFSGTNTACRMWAAGGMNTKRKGWRIYGQPVEGKQLCTMCNNNWRKSG